MQEHHLKVSFSPNYVNYSGKALMLSKCFQQNLRKPFYEVQDLN